MCAKKFCLIFIVLDYHKNFLTTKISWQQKFPNYNIFLTVMFPFNHTYIYAKREIMRNPTDCREIAVEQNMSYSSPTVRLPAISERPPEEGEYELVEALPYPPCARSQSLPYH